MSYEISPPEQRTEHIRELEQKIHDEVFEPWAEPYSRSSAFSLLTYNPAEYLTQRIDIVEFEPIPASLAEIYQYGAIYIGQETYEAFIETLQEDEDLPRIQAMLEAGENVAFVGPHTQIMDVAVYQNALTSALENEANIERSMILVNPMTSRLGVMDTQIPVPGFLQKSSRVITAIPGTPKATRLLNKAEIDESFLKLREYQVLRALAARIKDGGLALYIAPSGGVAELTAEGDRQEIPAVKDVLAKLLAKHFWLKPLAIHKNEMTGETKWEVGKLQRISDPEQLHTTIMPLLAEMGTAVTPRPIVYASEKTQ